MENQAREDLRVLVKSLKHFLSLHDLNNEHYKRRKETSPEGLLRSWLLWAILTLPQRSQDKSSGKLLS